MVPSAATGRVDPLLPHRAGRWLLSWKRASGLVEVLGPSVVSEVTVAVTSCVFLTPVSSSIGSGAPGSFPGSCHTTVSTLTVVWHAVAHSAGNSTDALRRRVWS